VRIDHRRRRLLATLAYGAGGLAAARTLGALPAIADTALDVQILQTASSLEALAVAGYERAQAAPVAGAGVETFLAEAARKHLLHKQAFQAQTTVLDPKAKVQDSPNPKFLPMLDSADLSTGDKVLDLTALLEQVATDTYIRNLTVLADATTKAVMGRVMAVHAQHLAALRMMRALLKGGIPQLVSVPFPATSIRSLPETAVTAAFPDALHQVGGADLVAEPASGAVT
jgi:hypothetical protein